MEQRIRPDRHHDLSRTRGQAEGALAPQARGQLVEILPDDFRVEPDGDVVALAGQEQEVVVVAKGVLAAGEAAIHAHPLVARIEETAEADASGQDQGTLRPVRPIRLRLGLARLRRGLALLCRGIPGHAASLLRALPSPLWVLTRGWSSR